MRKIRVDVWLAHARRYAAAASDIAQQAEMRAHEAQHSSARRRRRSRDLIEQGKAALARGRKRQAL